MSNDLLRRLVRGLIEEGGKVKKEPLKIYADNKESYFQVKYMDITMPGKDGVTMEKRGNVVLLKKHHRVSRTGYGKNHVYLYYLA